MGKEIREPEHGFLLLTIPQGRGTGLSLKAFILWRSTSSASSALRTGCEETQGCRKAGGGGNLRTWWGHCAWRPLSRAGASCWAQADPRHITWGGSYSNQLLEVEGPGGWPGVCVGSS